MACWMVGCQYSANGCGGQYERKQSQRYDVVLEKTLRTPECVCGLEERETGSERLHEDVHTCFLDLLSLLRSLISMINCVGMALSGRPAMLVSILHLRKSTQASPVTCFNSTAYMIQSEIQLVVLALIHLSPPLSTPFG